MNSFWAVTRTLAEDKRELALLFKDLATLRTNAEVFDDVDELRWSGPTSGFAAIAQQLDDDRLLARSSAAHRG